MKPAAVVANEGDQHPMRLPEDTLTVRRAVVLDECTGGAWCEDLPVVSFLLLAELLAA